MAHVNCLHLSYLRDRSDPNLALRVFRDMNVVPLSIQEACSQKHEQISGSESILNFKNSMLTLSTPAFPRPSKCLIERRVGFQLRRNDEYLRFGGTLFFCRSPFGEPFQTKMPAKARGCWGFNF